MANHSGNDRRRRATDFHTKIEETLPLGHYHLSSSGERSRTKHSKPALPMANHSENDRGRSATDFCPATQRSATDIEETLPLGHYLSSSGERPKTTRSKALPMANHPENDRGRWCQTKGGGPRRETIDSDGLRAWSINNASKTYHMPNRRGRPGVLRF